MSISPKEGGPIETGARIGHAQLKVADLKRALAFYAGALGFELMYRGKLFYSAMPSPGWAGAAF
jgi:catechol 2,3-dioxygenase-like lactoylglutathione lyase family enzyme